MQCVMFRTLQVQVPTISQIYVLVANIIIKYSTVLGVQVQVPSILRIYTVNRKNTPKCFLIYSLQNLTDCDKIWYILSRVNLSCRNINVFRLT